jgi:hypothetical protein
MTASMLHVTKLTPGSDNPSRAYGNKHRLVTASTVSVTNLTPPGSDDPTVAACVARCDEGGHPTTVNYDALKSLRLNQLLYFFLGFCWRKVGGGSLLQPPSVVCSRGGERADAAAG